MDTIRQFITSVQDSVRNIAGYVCLFAVLLVGYLLVSSLLRFLFSRPGQFSKAIYSAAQLLCLFVLCIALSRLMSELFHVPLPFLCLTDQGFILCVGNGIAELCEPVFRLLVIAFAVNLVNCLLPSRERPLLRLLLCAVAVLTAMTVNALLYTADLGLYAPALIVAVLIVLILLGSLRLLAGIALGIFNPIVGLLYTFFFSNIIGRALSRAIVTTALLTACVLTVSALA